MRIAALLRNGRMTAAMVRRVIRPATTAAIVVALAGGWVRTVGAAGEVSTGDAVRRAVRYVAWYDTQLPQLVADERYEQRSSGGVARVLESAVAWVPAPGLHDVLAVRDVHTVDHSAVQSSRIRALLEAGPSTAAMAQEILRASAAFNLGPGVRNLNFPTFPLVYLRGDRASRLRWRSQAEPDGTLRLEFEERERPTIVRDGDGRPMRARGQFWIAPDSGRIVRCGVTVTGRHDDVNGNDRDAGIRRELTYTITVQFEANDRLDLWLPSRMSEVYEQSSRRDDTTARLQVTGEARYANYRRFETQGRIVRP